MIFFLLNTLIFFLLFSLYLFKTDWLSLTVVFSITYLVSLIVLAMNSKDWEITLSFKTYAVITVGVLLIFIGELVARSLVKNSEKKQSEILEKSIVLPQMKLTNLIIGFMTVVLLLYIQHIKTSVSSIGLVDQTIVGAYGKSENNMSIILKLAITLTLPIAYYYLLATLQYLIYKGKIVKRNLLPVIIYFIIVALSATRMDILYLFISGMVISYITIQNKKGWVLTFSFKFIFKVLLSVVLLLVAFYLLGFLTGKSNNLNFFYILSLYIGSPVAALNVFLESFSYEVTNFGNETLIGLNNFLEVFGFEVDFANERILELILIGNMPTRTNIYTSFRRVINDYGYIGMIIYQFSVGFIFSYVYENIKKKKWENESLSILVYVYFFRYFLFGFTEERIIVNVFTMTTVIQLIVIGLLIKFSKVYFIKSFGNKLYFNKNKSPIKNGGTTFEQ